jgi:hypothetical protein
MYEAKLIEVLFPHLAGVCVDRVEDEGGGVRVDARASGLGATCPLCGVESVSVHSRYQRQLVDLPVSGRAVRILLTVRRFFCRNSDCARRTFVEQVEDLTLRRRRRSVGLLALLAKVGLALAGRAGARLAAAMAVLVSRMTLLRGVSWRLLPSAANEHVLGVTRDGCRSPGWSGRRARSRAGLGGGPGRRGVVLSEEGWPARVVDNVQQGCDVLRGGHVVDQVPVGVAVRPVQLPSVGAVA